MSYKGTVKNGVVVLQPDANLPDGMNVLVESEPPSRSGAASGSEDDPLFDMSKYAGDTGISDLAVNLDHYLYGHPTVRDAR
jgi:hypothetical protein